MNQVLVKFIHDLRGPLVPLPFHHARLSAGEEIPEERGTLCGITEIPSRSAAGQGLVVDNNRVPLPDPGKVADHAPPPFWRWEPRYTLPGRPDPERYRQVRPFKILVPQPGKPVTHADIHGVLSGGSWIKRLRSPGRIWAGLTDAI